MVARILDIPIHTIDYEESTATVGEFIAQAARPSAFIVQTNVLTVVNAYDDVRYKTVIRKAALSVPDGMPLVWLLRAKGCSIRDRVYGPDLMLLLCAEAVKKRWRCFLYGGNTGVPEQLRDVLTRRFPGLQIVGTYSPPYRELTVEEDATVCQMINDAKPDIVWVGLGAPKQDIWMHEHRERLNVSVLHGVGAAFDFLTGRVKQAPRWMMNAGLEWLYRLCQEPKRLWRRYTVTNAKFAYYLLKELITK